MQCANPACRRPLKYLPRKDARYNARYCSLGCYHMCPPKLADAMAGEGATDIVAFLLAHLNEGRSLDCVAHLLGVNKQALLAWMMRHHITRVAGRPHQIGRYDLATFSRNPRQLALF